MHALALGNPTRLLIGTHVEANNHRLGSRGQIDIGLIDATNRLMHDRDLDLISGKLDQCLRQRFLRTLHIGFDDQRQLLHVAFGHLLEHVLELCGLLTCEFDITELALTEQRNFTGLAFVAQHNHIITGVRHFCQTLDLNRNRRAGRLCRFAVFVDHRADPAK